MSTISNKNPVIRKVPAAVREAHHRARDTCWAGSVESRLVRQASNPPPPPFNSDLSLLLFHFHKSVSYADGPAAADGLDMRNDAARPICNASAMRSVSDAAAGLDTIDIAAGDATSGVPLLAAGDSVDEIVVANAGPLLVSATGRGELSSGRPQSLPLAGDTTALGDATTDVVFKIAWILTSRSVGAGAGGGGGDVGTTADVDADADSDACTADVVGEEAAVDAAADGDDCGAANGDVPDRVGAGCVRGDGPLPWRERG